MRNLLLIFTEQPTIYLTFTQMIFWKSGLQFFPSESVMLDRVNIVGHGYDLTELQEVDDNSYLNQCSIHL